MSELPIEPAWTRWHNSVSKCESCGAEPADRVKKHYWRKQVADHGHGFPPKKYIKPTEVLSKAQDAVKEAPKEKDPNVLFDDEDMGMEPQEPKVANAAKKRKLREWEHFHYLPESTKKFATSED